MTEPRVLGPLCEDLDAYRATGGGRGLDIARWSGTSPADLVEQGIGR